MINKFNKFNNKMNESIKEESQKLIDDILDKINTYGYDNISSIEKEILKKVSKEGIDSLKEYIDSDSKLSFDKHGHILIDGLPYIEWKMKDDNDNDNKEKNKYNWEGTKKNKNKSKQKMPDYRVNVYKNDESNILYYYIFIVEGDLKGKIKKYSTEKSTEQPFGIITSSKSWYENRIKNNKMPYTMKQFHNEILSYEYDHFKELAPDELKEFEILMNLRKLFIRDKNNLPKKYIKALNELFNKFSNL